MPRKAASPTEPSERRASSRIASQPKKEVPVAEKKSSKPAEKKAKATEPAQEKAKSASAPNKRKSSPAGEDKEDDAPAKEIKKNKASEAKPKSVEKSKPTSKSNGSAGSSKQLQVGDSVPQGLTLSDEAGGKVEIGDLKKTVIFMYPKANTGGCTKQGQCYRDEYASWQKLGFSVYGLSNDNPTPLKNWKEKQSFPYKLISDPERKLIAALTGTASKTIRSHVVIDSKGKLVDIKLGVSPGESSKAALQAAEKAE
ncbi:unnamed protein product [Sympodiomycopsis kandeliae]